MHLADNIDIHHGALGGLILGLSSSVFLVLTGRITGLSGIAEGLVKFGGEDWNWTYMAGLTFSGVVLSKLKPDSFGSSSALAPALCITAGILTGFGTRMAAGCTSGHGLCGLSRRSPRSLAAVLSFMFSGAVTAYAARSGKLPVLPDIPVPNMSSPLLFWGPTVGVLALGALSSKPSAKKNASSIAMHVACFASAVAFGLGLGVSGMCSPDRVVGFLDFSNASLGWDPTLMSVLGAGCTVTFLTFHYFKAAKTPVVLSSNPVVNLDDVLKMGTVKENLVIDWNLVVGSLIFGAGWGLSGMCPGPAMVALGGSVESAGLYVPSMLLGMKIKEWLL